MCVCQGHAICANRGYSVTLKPLSQFPVGSSSTVVSKGFQSRRFTRSVGRQPAITHSSDANTRHPRPRKQFVSTKGDRGCISFLCASRAKATTKSRNEEAWNSLPGLISRNFPGTGCNRGEIMEFVACSDVWRRKLQILLRALHVK